MNKKEKAGRIQWNRMLKKLNPYTIKKGFRYLKHYGPKEFWIRLHERFEPEEVPYGPWYEAYVPDESELEKQRKHRFTYEPLISVAVPAFCTPETFLIQMVESLLAQTYSKLGALYCKRKSGGYGYERCPGTIHEKRFPYPCQ